MAGKNRYDRLILRVFERYFKKGVTEFEFERVELEQCAAELEMELPKNIGDILYFFATGTNCPKK